jgi:hypothetical protein
MIPAGSTRAATRIVVAATLSWIAAAAIAHAESPGDFLVTTGATWRYLDDGTDQGTAWRATGFADGGWAQGPAELGYGDGGEATIVDCGPSSPTCTSGNSITTYFRKRFTVVDAASIQGLELKIQRDDGAVVFLNGAQIATTNMPGGSITYTTLASTAVGGADETAYLTFPISPAELVNGPNVLAVEVHQRGATSSDISFDASLEVTPGLTLSLARAPYLQNVTPIGAVVRWRTNTASTTRVLWGLAPALLTNTAEVAGTRTEHVVPITGLPTETRIYYSVGSTTQTLAGGDANHFLDVPPLAGQRRPIRIWVTGDHGMCAATAQGCTDAAAVRNGYTTFAGANLADLWLMLGDNAYGSGTDTEFTNGQFNVYPTIMRNTPFWSAPGNHEFGSGGADSPTQSGPYYDSHTFPTAGEAGGVPSGTEAYYSFDYGSIHVITLDSHDTSRTAPSNPTTNICPAGGGGAGAMYQWACADLAATDKDFIIAIWHHPPYTKGSHDSDTESQLIEMRQRFLPVMERYGVDLVLTGHSHSYERSVLLDEHYGHSTTYSPALHAVDAGDGSPTGDGAYEKAAIGPFGNTGTISALTGSASQIDGGSLNHPVMEKSLSILGSMVIDVVGRQLDARMIGVAGNVLDHFQIVKGPVLPVCDDGIDQDADALFDYPNDPDCASASDDTEQPPPPVCSNGLDDDGDTFIDYPADPGCASALSTNESPQCNDGLDNDSDTLTDLVDPGCLDGADDDESAIFPSCSNGLDDDGDTLIDFPNDPGCVDAMSNLEDPQCSDALDNDGDTLTDLADPDCASAADDLEQPPPAVCSDGLDNDGDGLTDFPADPGCFGAGWPNEQPKCDDELDNDGDGKIDWDGGIGSGTPDPQCVHAYMDKEGAPSSCGLGAEIALATAGIVALRRRSRRA